MFVYQAFRTPFTFPDSIGADGAVHIISRTMDLGHLSYLTWHLLFLHPFASSVGSGWVAVLICERDEGHVTVKEK